MKQAALSSSASGPNLIRKGMRSRWRFSIPGWHLVEYVSVRLLAAGLNGLPITLATGIARRIGEILYCLLVKRRQIALHNLDIAFRNSKTAAEKKQIALDSFRHMVTSVFEFFRMPLLVREAQERFSQEGIEHTDRVFREGRGVILVVAHLGAWELMEFIACLNSYPCSVIVKPLRNPYLHRWIQSLRLQSTFKPIDKDSAVKPALTELRRAHMLAILIDQWAGDEGLQVNFFGQPTSTTSLPARLARKTGAALIPGCCLRVRPGKYLIKIFPEIPLKNLGDDWEMRATEELNHWLEEAIRQHPDQWSWVHRRWK